MSNKYVIVHFIEGSKEPHDFSSSEWPLHLTLLGNFNIELTAGQLITELDKFASATAGFEVKVEKEDSFGVNHDISVSLINKDGSITRLHLGLMKLMNKLGATYDSPDFVGEGYRPHVTIQLASRVNAGQAFLVDDLTLVDMAPDDDNKKRKVIKTFKFRLH